MRKIALLLFVTGLILSPAFQGQCAWVSVGGGHDPRITVQNADESGFRLTLDFAGFEAASFQQRAQRSAPLQESLFERLSFKGSGSWGELGKPELPALRKLALLPDRSGWRWEIVDADYVELSGHAVAPLQEETLETPNGPVEPQFEYNEDAYQQDRWFPEKPIELDQPIIMRDWRLGRISLFPIQFNPARGVLRVYRRMTIQIVFDGPGEEPLERPHLQKSRVFAQLVKASVLNPSDELDQEGVLGGYLFITPPALQNTLQTNLVEWKKEKGFPCTVATTTQTGTTNAQIKAYVQNIYNTWPVPPDYLVLVGDADSPYNMPTFLYSGNNDYASDLPYTLLEGADYFPDMLAGRLSVDSDNDLLVVCAKIRGYEKDPYMSSTTWFTRGLMVYDYNGSESCQTTKWNCRDLMLAHGYTTVDQVTNPPTYNGGTAVNNAINTGVTFVNYRGYGSYSSWTPPNYYSSDIYNLNNGFKLPVITSIVCGGGAFTNGTDPVFGEVWIRAGTPTTPKGAVSFCGPSSLYTHTRWNNCIDVGIYQGIFEEGIGDFGSALLRGKMELYNNMPLNLGPGGTTNSVECYFHIYNILGDPGLEMWTGVPATLTVTHPSTMAQGVNSFPLSVMVGSTPVEGALACVYKAGSNQVTAWTSASGSALMDLGDATAGTYAVTVTGHNLKTYHGTLTISQQNVALSVDSLWVDDDMIGESSGDGDGLFNPGETIELGIVLKNTGSSQNATNISATISSTDPYLTITQSTLTGPDAAPGSTSPLTDDFNLVLSPEAPHSHIVQITLVANCAQGSWTNLINLPVVAGLAEAMDDTVLNTGGILNPGQTANVGITLHNSGGDPLNNCLGTLSSPDPLLTVTDASGSWGAVAAGASATNFGNPFGLHAQPNCPPGWSVPLQLIVNAGVYADTLTVPFVVGRIMLTDPAGPDAYGYRCFDSRDLQYTQLPVYSWIEASTQPGQTTLSLPDYGTEQDAVVLQNLPFTFRYYGQNYNQISICSNGWIAMGNTLYTDPRNWNIPGAAGPPAMIAPFWDDLRLDAASAHYWYNSADHRAVVEWKDVHTHYGWGLNRFEIILNDPAYYPTTTGDGEIIFQYYTFNNVDASENYCTVGIENQTQTDGVKVTYASQYSPGSATIAAGVALKFTTDIDYTPVAPDVTVTLTPYGIPIQIPPNGGSFGYNIAVANNETSPVNFSVWCDITLPNGSIYGPVLGPVDITMPAGYSINRDRTQNVPGSAPAGVYDFNAYAGSYPGIIWDSTSFIFTKLNNGLGDLVVGWLNQGELFEGEVTQVAAELPTSFALLGARPNPFNPSTVLRYDLRAASLVELAVYDLSGREVTRLVAGWRAAGTHEAIFDGSGLASGIYLARLKAGSFVGVKKMMLLK